MRPCAWNRVRGTQSGGQRRMMRRCSFFSRPCTEDVFFPTASPNAHFTLSSLKPPPPSTEHKITSWGGKNGIRYLNIHSNLSSSISTSSCRVNHELRAAARCNAVAQVSKRTAHSFTSAELKSECVFTVKEGSPSAAPVPPQTIFLCALCPVRVRCIPFPKPHSPPPQKPRRSSAGNKPRK